MYKKGGALGVVVLIVLVAVLIGALYFLYQNLPGELKELKPVDSIEEDEIPGSNLDGLERSQQFYENMRFPNREISYGVSDECDSEKIADIKGAFDILEGRTVLDFSRVSNNPQIQVYCSEDAPEPEDKGHFVAGEGGPSEVINTSLYGVILKGQMSLYRDEKCDTPHIALHELLHVLGFDHNNDPDSILYPTLDCDQALDDYFVEEINRLYEMPGAADLKIVELEASKAGRYLNFEIKVVNQGLLDVFDAKLRVYGDGKVIEFTDSVTKEERDYLDLGDLEVGTTKRLTVENARMSGRGVEEVVFIVDEDREIDELFENNNRLELRV